METLGGLWSAGASALAVLTGRSANVDDDSKLSRDPSDVSTASGDEDEHAHSLEDAVPSTPSGDLHEDWMMVVEDRASVARAVPMGDVHAQRVSFKGILQGMIFNYQRQPRDTNKSSQAASPLRTRPPSSFATHPRLHPVPHTNIVSHVRS